MYLGTPPHVLTEILRKLEVWNFVRSIRPPKTVTARLEKIGIKKYLDFLIKGQKPNNFCSVDTRRVGLEPMSLEYLLKEIDAPEHLVNRAVQRMARQRILQRFTTFSCRGEKITALRIKNWPRIPTGLEFQILNAIARYYREQRKALDEARNVLLVRSCDESLGDL